VNLKPSEILARARRAAEGFRAASRVLELLARLLPENDDVTELIGLRDGMERGFNALTTIELSSAESEVLRLETELPGLEWKLETLDATIPMGWFRDHFEVSKESPVALADYAALLGRHIKDSSARLDRIQFLLTRLIALFVPPEEATRERRLALLAEALPHVAVDESVRTAALAFFAEAGKRLAGVERLEALVDSGFFVDLVGYKLSLRQQLLDPDITTSAIELNGAISECLKRLASESSSGSDLGGHFAEVDRRIRETFQKLREDERPTQQRFERWLAQNAAKRARPAAPPPVAVPSLGRVPRVDRRVLLAVAAVGLFAASPLLAPGARLTELSSAELARLSPVLTSGVVVPRAAPRSFVGRVDMARWKALPRSSRSGAAVSLAQALTARGLVSGTVMSEQEIVVRIEQGTVLLVH
jgi:hypothetical protein